MESPLLISLSKADVLTRQMDIVANNIANANTTGFKQQNILFETKTETPQRGEPLNFVTDRSSYRDLTAGPVLQTGNPMDVALSGPGYLAVKDSSGTVYTRAGALKLSTEGNIVDAQGNTVLSDGGDAITVPDNVSQIGIGEDGTVTGDQGVLGKLQISEFTNAQSLTPTGNGYFAANGATATPAADTTMVQGALESSNVQPVVEMTQMMDISRQYQFVQNIISQEHDRIRNAIHTLGKTS